MPVAALPAFWGAVGATAGAGSAIYGAHKQSSAAKNAAQLQTDSANRAAELEANSASEALAFTREQEDTRRREWEDTQKRNFQIYQDQQAELAPYRAFGRGAIGQLASPIPGAPPPGSIGDRVGVR